MILTTNVSELVKTITKETKQLCPNGKPPKIKLQKGGHAILSKEISQTLINHLEAEEISSSEEEASEEEDSGEDSDEDKTIVSPKRPKKQMVKKKKAIAKKKTSSKNTKKKDVTDLTFPDEDDESGVVDDGEDSEGFIDDDEAEEEECPVCCETLPRHGDASTDHGLLPCCGKLLCGSCFRNLERHAAGEKQLCVLCRQPYPETDAEVLPLLEQRAAAGHPHSKMLLAYRYAAGEVVKRDQALALQDIQAAIEVASVHGKVGVVGYCFGGLLTWLSACELQGVSAASAYYGGGLAGEAGRTAECPVIMHFGELDAHIPMSDVEKVKDAQPDVQVYVYGADHGFNCDQRASYHAESAATAKERTLAFFAEQLA